MKRLLSRHRELRTPPDRPDAGTALADASITCRRTRSHRRRELRLRRRFAVIPRRSSGRKCRAWFRLPPALDNRPLNFEDRRRVKQVVFVSATPSIRTVQVPGVVVEQMVRPTGLIDPPIEVRPSKVRSMISGRHLRSSPGGSAYWSPR